MSQIIVKKISPIYFIIPTFLLLLIIVLLINYDPKNRHLEQELKSESGSKKESESEQEQIIIRPSNGELLAHYDQNKLFNPFSEPSRRVPYYQIPRYHFKRLIDIPTRGYPDNYTQLGIIIEEEKENNNGQEHTENKHNRILRLFGRETFPRSDKWEYYIMINSGHDAIKIPIEVSKSELYSDDIIRVPELNSKYKVQLYNFDAPRYYPDII